MRPEAFDMECMLIPVSLNHVQRLILHAIFDHSVPQKSYAHTLFP